MLLAVRRIPFSQVYPAVLGMFSLWLSITLNMGSAAATSIDTVPDHAEAVGIVVSLDGSENPAWLTRENLEQHIRNFVERELPAPPAGDEWSRDDLPVSVINPDDFYRHHDTDNQLITVWRFVTHSVSFPGSAAAATVLSYTLTYHILGADSDVLVGTIGQAYELSSLPIIDDPKAFWTLVEDEVSMKLRRMTTLLRRQPPGPPGQGDRSVVVAPWG